MDTRFFLGCIGMIIPAGLVYLMITPLIWDRRAANCSIETLMFWKRCRRLAMLAVYIFCITLLLAGAAKAGTVDLSHDNNKRGSSLGVVVVAGSPIPQVNSLAIADTTGYYELFPFGTTARLGDASISAYAGVEGMKGVSARPRGMAIASYTSGNFCATVIVEFAGNTGNFNKQVLCYKAGPVTYSIVRHGVAGGGVRIDFKSGPYFQLLENRMTIGVITNF